MCVYLCLDGVFEFVSDGVFEFVSDSVFEFVSDSLSRWCVRACLDRCSSLSSWFFVDDALVCVSICVLMVCKYCIHVL